MATTVTNGCQDCGDETLNGYNPKTDYPWYYQRGSSSIGYLADPVEEEVRDIRRAQWAYITLPIIPFFDRSDANLQLMRKLAALSPTEGSCINSIGDYVLGGGVQVIDKVRPGVSTMRATRKDEAAENEALDIIEEWHPEIDITYLLDQLECLYKNWAIFGNMVLRVRWYTVGGEKYLHFKTVDCEEFRYWATYPNEPKVGVISEKWTIDYINQYPPDFVGVWPNVTETDDGVFETLVVHHNKVPGRPWYGLPRSAQALYYKYWEYQLGSYGTRGYRNQWTGRVFLETAGDNVEQSHVESFRQDLRATFTQDGKGRTLVHRHRGSAHPETRVHEFKDPTTHEFHATTADIAERNIIKAHNWHRVLMGVPTPGRLGGENDFANIYRVKERTVIRPTQDIVCRPVNTMLGIAEQWFGREYDFSISLAQLFTPEDLDPTANQRMNPGEEVDAPAPQSNPAENMDGDESQ